ncbi:MAG: LamG domain-containing protein, partial [Bacteroidetes bacterium]|nr:LamG domain-containing protein [Bacteroidota bacterium]
MIRSYTLPFLALCSLPATAQYPGLVFDGQNDQVTVPNAVLNSIGTGPFTVEAWVRGVEADQPSHPRILSNRDAVNNGFMFAFHGLWGGSNHKMVNLQLDGLNYILINNGTFNASVLDGTCHHIAVSKGVDSLRFYVDGAHIGSKVLQGNPSVATTAANMVIGNDGPDPHPFNGHLSQLRLWDHVRSPAEILSNKDQSIAGTTPGLVGYWELNEGSGQDIADKTGTTNGLLGTNEVVEDEDPAWNMDGCPVTSMGRCLVFDGADDQVTLSSTAVNAIGTGDFTVEAEIRAVEADQLQHPRILSNRDQVNNGFLFGFHGVWGGSNYKMINMQLDGLNYILINNGSYNGSLMDGTCHHIAVTKSADSLRFYADGMHIGSKVLQGAPSTTTTATSMLIGNDAPDPQPFNGNIAQLRVWNEARSAAEIVANMGVSIPGNTPGLVGYWEMNDAGGQLVQDKTTTADGLLGTASILESGDPIWVEDCCDLSAHTGLSAIGEPIDLQLHPNPLEDLLTIERGSSSGAAR